MSADDLEEQKARTDVSRFAPPRYRLPPGAATILPVLERLSRGEHTDQSSPEAGKPLPAEEPLHAHGASAPPKFPLSMTGRLAVAMGLVALLTAASVTFLPSKAEHPASKAASKPASKTATALDKPKTVHTLSLRPETARATQASTVGQSPPPPAENPDRGAPATTGAAPAVADPALALTSPLRLWAMFPDDAAAESPAVQDTKNSANDPVKDSKDVKHTKPDRTAVRHHRSKATKQARRRRPVRRRRTRAVAAKPQPAQPTAQPAEAQANAIQPVKKLPLQAALDSLFGSSDDSAPGALAPANDQATFR